MSSHYFIGKRLNPYESKKLESSLSYVLRKNSFLPQHDSTKDFMTSFIYLGYLNDQVAYDLLNVLDPYILALAQNTPPTKCSYKYFELSGNKTTHKNVSIAYQSENNLVHNVIMPYLQYALEEILEEPHKELLGYEPNVNLVKVRSQFLSQFRNNNKIIKEQDVELLPTYFVGRPQNRNTDQYFMFDSIDVIKGKPEELKSGTQSQTDRLILDTIRSVPLRGSKNNKNQKLNQNQNQNQNLNQTPSPLNSLINEYKETHNNYEENIENRMNAVNQARNNPEFMEEISSQNNNSNSMTTQPSNQSNLNNKNSNNKNSNNRSVTNNNSKKEINNSKKENNKPKNNKNMNSLLNDF